MRTAGAGELSGEHRCEPVEHTFEPHGEAVLEAVGVVRSASVEDYAREEWVVAALDQALDIGSLDSFDFLHRIV
jgi:hypothetical protein